MARPRIGARRPGRAARRATRGSPPRLLPGPHPFGDRARARDPHGHREDPASSGVRQAPRLAGLHQGLGAMNAHDQYVENRAGFVARSLEAAEERAFRDHLAGCAECTADVARMERDLAWLPMAVTPENPPPGFARQSAAQILRRRGRWRQWVPYGLAAAGLLVAIGIG